MKRIGLAALLGLCAAPAFAQDAAPADAPPLCTDRPGKGDSPCTVPAGAVQLETELFDWAEMTAGGIRTDTIIYTNPMLKYGLSDRSDIQLSMVPYQEVRTRTGNVVDRIGGIGDLFVRYKQRLTGASGGVQVALLPYLKLPTARSGLGNGRVEGGLEVPVNIDLPKDFSLSFSPELDLLADAVGTGRHLSVQNVVNVGKTIGKVTLGAELWGQANYDPSGTVRQYSADVTAAWLARKTLQLDAGLNFGLNRNTPGIQFYAGVSTRF